ncbi:nucleoside triphosphate pyrophosphohydrolase [bacterium B17]|nr:nucleoside triphosphate pyrophosphohydrolase [bacterium B17]
MDRFLGIVDQLRDEGGCAWDRAQTLDSLKDSFIEECYEVIDSIDTGDIDHHMEELGDLLLHICLQSRIRKEEGAFVFNDVVERIAEKLIRRHPHVFGDAPAEDPVTALKSWESMKAEEKKETRESVLDGVPRQLPALHRAQRLQGRAARVGFDWDKVENVVDKIDEELEETKSALVEGDSDKLKDEIGDLLFAVVNLSRFQNISSEDALSGTIGKFISRFQYVEKKIKEEGRKLSDCSLDEMEHYWQESKSLED